jgi:hypothetical protein
VRVCSADPQPGDEAGGRQNSKESGREDRYISHTKEPEQEQVLDAAGENQRREQMRRIDPQAISSCSAASR